MRFAALLATASVLSGVAVAQNLTPIPASSQQYDAGYTQPAPTLPAPSVYQSTPDYPASPQYQAPRYQSPQYQAAPLPISPPASSHYAPAPAYADPIYAAPVAGPAYGPAYGPAFVGGPVAAPVRQLPVRYKDLKNIAPCAVPQTVCVDGKCGVQYVDICAPEGCVDIKKKRNKTVFDYGDYEVEIHEKKGGLVVDYDD